MVNKTILRFINTFDAEEVLTIYAYYVKNTAITFETELPSVEEFTKRISEVSKNYPWLVALQDGKIVAYAFAKMHRPTGAYLWSPEVTIYVANDFQGKGIGKSLYEALFAILKLQGFHSVFAGIVLPNLKSIALHQSLGFEEIGVFKNIGFKLGKWHSSQWMQKSLGQDQQVPSNPISISELMNMPKLNEILVSSYS